MAVVVAVVAVLACAGPANAGGSNWHPDRGSYVPGDRARIVAAVSWGHNEDLGTPADGPFGVWLAPAGEPISEGIAPVPGAIYLGDIAIDAVDVPLGPHVASLDFVIPDLPPGDYAIQHCNWPCTTSLGDITYGHLTVRDPSAPPPTFAPTPTTEVTSTTTTPTSVVPTSAPPPPTTVVAATPLVASSSAGPPSWLGVAGAAVAVVALGAALVWLLPRRSGQPTVNPT